MHELDLGHNLGDEFKPLEVIQREIRTGGGQVEAFVADLDDSQNLVRRHRAPALTSAYKLWRDEAAHPSSAFGLMLSKMLACFTRVKLLNNSTFLVTAV